MATSTKRIQSATETSRNERAGTSTWQLTLECGHQLKVTIRQLDWRPEGALYSCGECAGIRPRPFLVPQPS